MATTHIDTNVNQLVINKMTKQEYDNLSQVSETELYLVEEQVDSVVTQNSTNPVQSGAVYDAIQDIGSAINDGTTLFVKNNRTVGITSANQALDKTITIPNDIIMCKMSDGIVYDSYITYTKIKQYLPDYPYYSDDLNWEIGGNPPMRASITEGNYYLDVDTNHIFVADEVLELLDITSSVVIHGDPNKLYCDVDTNILYRYDGNNFVPLCEGKNEIVDNLIIAKDSSNGWYAYPFEGTIVGYVNSTQPPEFWDRKKRQLYTFTEEDNGKYFYDDIDNAVYMYFHSNNPYLYNISNVALYYLENLDTTKTYISYNTNKIYRTNDGTEFKLIATNSYNDLTDKPLSVENSKVKYTLTDGTTKLTLVQENDLKTVAFSGSYNDLADKLQNATTTDAGLMSAEDKTKLNNITINQITLTTNLLCGRITGSGNYLEIFIPCALPSSATNVALTLTALELYFDGTRSNITYDNITNNIIIPLVGVSFDLHLTSTQTPNKTFFVLVSGTLTFNR